MPLRKVDATIPAGVERVVMQALEKEPQARPRDIGEMIVGLRGTGGQATVDVGDAVAGLPTGRAQTREGESPQTVAVGSTVVSQGVPRRARWKLIGAVVLVASAPLFLALGGLDLLRPSRAGQTTAKPPPPSPARPADAEAEERRAEEERQARLRTEEEARWAEEERRSEALRRQEEQRRAQGKGARIRPEAGREPSKGQDGVASSAGTARIRRQVEQTLRGRGPLKEGGANTLGLTVDITADGIVTLTGGVRDRQQRIESVRLAKAVPGVTEVRDGINVQGSWRSLPE